MRKILKPMAMMTIASMVLAACGRKDKGDGGDDDEAPAPTPAVEEDGLSSPGGDPASGEVSFDLATGCTGEETTAMLLNATGQKLAELDAAKQGAILAAQSRLAGDRNLELSTAAHITNKLNLTAEIGEAFATQWSGSNTTAGYAAIAALYGPFPSGDSLALVLFGKAFYERVFGGSMSSAGVSHLSTMLAALDEAAVDANDVAVPPASDTAKVVALVVAIGASMCIN